MDDLEDHALNNLRLPPRTYDAMREAVAEEAAELRAAKGFRAEPGQQSLVDLRQRLSRGTSLDEMKLLKLRAYHRGVEERREEAKAEAEDERKALMKAFDVPLDSIPDHLIKATPEQLGARWLKAIRARRSREVRATEDSGEESAYESEWATNWASPSYLSISTARGEVQQSDHHRPLPESWDSRQAEDARNETLQAISPAISLAGYREWRPYCEYTPEYVSQQGLQGRVRAQRVHRSLAFWIPLCAALGASLLRRMRTKTKPGKKKKSEERV